MRLRVGGSVILLDRKQLMVMTSLLAACILVLWTTVGRHGSNDVTLPEPIPIERALRQRRQNDVRQSPNDVIIVTQRRQQDGGKSLVMAMDEARRSRGPAIAAAQRKLIGNQHRAADSRYNINVTLSDVTSLDRALPDTRPPACLSAFANVYGDVTLPTMTVIIPFYNEALTMLLRAIHSVLNRSPDHLLDEIILVDDCSPDPDLQQPLNDYLRLLPKVRLIRHAKRQGLIVSRMDGARQATSPTLFFMDAHAEVNDGWLEPLLAELKRNPKQILQPFIDGIDAMTLSFTAPGVYHKGSFSWDLRYTWLRVKDHEQHQAMATGLPFFTPTLVGCAIAVQKQYFMDIGSFDEGLKVWGGENIELGFRAWMCGGHVTTVTCSRVGHVFKEFPYQFDGNKEDIVQKNLIRVAEVWMDGLRKYFYASTRIYDFKRAELTSDEELNSLAERRQLRQKLGCRNFEWYMYNVIPELAVPPMDANYHGEIKSLQTQACWVVTDDYYVTMTYVCYHHKIIPENHFSLKPDGTLHYFDRCVASVNVPYLELVECPTTNEQLAAQGWWNFERTGVVWGALVYRRVSTQTNREEEYCITQVTNAMAQYRGDQMPQLLACNSHDQFQQWAFTYGFDFTQVPSSALTP